MDSTEKRLHADVEPEHSISGDITPQLAALAKLMGKLIAQRVIGVQSAKIYTTGVDENPRVRSRAQPDQEHE
jgi:hypothetical protein